MTHQSNSNDSTEQADEQEFHTQFERMVAELGPLPLEELPKAFQGRGRSTAEARLNEHRCDVLWPQSSTGSEFSPGNGHTPIAFHPEVHEPIDVFNAYQAENEALFENSSMWSIHQKMHEDGYKDIVTDEQVLEVFQSSGEHVWGRGPDGDVAVEDSETKPATPA